MSLPTGVVTFLFTDIEGSGRLLERHGQRLIDALAGHQQQLDATVSRSGGVVFETVGDAAYAAFADPASAVRAAVDMQRRMVGEDWPGVGGMRVRAALHRGPVERRGAHYLGSALFRAARVVALAHGGQTLATTEVVDACATPSPDGIVFQDLGRQRLRDLAEPERVWQVDAPDLPAAFPPLRSVVTRLDQLPRSRTSFVGRDEELPGLVAMLARDRLVTLTGPGGIGKTRLAVETGHAALAALGDRFADGAVLADLTSARTPDDVPGTIAATLALRPTDGETAELALARWLADRRLLLIVDNCEHVIESATFLGRLLDDASDLVVLATSRERLRLRDERVVEVPPLESLGRDGARGAVRLFCDRAGIDPSLLSAPALAWVAELCARLDGLPLAIELAAARVPSGLALGDPGADGDWLMTLRAGPRDLPERHQALGAAIEWSVGLLSPDERTLFARLGVFARGWTIESAEAVCDPLPEGGAVADALQALVDKSLVRVGRADRHGKRYRMLETIREASAARLEASGEADLVRGRHLAWAVSFMEAAEAGRWGSEPGYWIARVNDEAPGMDAAVAHARATDDILAMCRIVGSTQYLAELMSGFPVMVRAWSRLAMDGLLGAAATVPGPIRAKAMITDAELVWYDGDHQGARDRLRSVFDLLERDGPSSPLGYAYLFLAEVATDVGPDDPDRTGSLQEGLAILDTASSVFQAAGDQAGVASVINSRGNVLADLGRTQESLAAFERAIAMTLEAAPGSDVNAMVISQAMVELAAGMVVHARHTVRRCLDWRTATGVPDPWIDAFTLLVVAGVAVEQSQFATAGRLVGVALQLQARSGQRTRAWDVSLAQTRVALDAASGGLAEGLIALGATLTAEEAFELAALVIGPEEAG